MENYNTTHEDPRMGPSRRGGRRFRGGPGFGEHLHGPHRGPGRRQRRGDVRAAVLLLLNEEPRNGYQIIQEISERSAQVWSPSPGSIYPVLQQLADEGLISESQGQSGRTFRLSDSGVALVNEQSETWGLPWDDAARGPQGPAREMMTKGRDVMMAARQVVVVGSPSQIAKAVAILAETRRALYGVLAEGDQSQS